MKLLWITDRCLLDTSSGASLSVRQQLVQLQKRQWQVKVVGATVFDASCGRLLLKDYWQTIAGNTTVQILDPLGLSHYLLVTKHCLSRDFTLSEANQLFNIYLHYLDSFQPDFVYSYGASVLHMAIFAEARQRGIKTLAYVANGNYLGNSCWKQNIDIILTNSQSTAEYYLYKEGWKLINIGTFVNPDQCLIQPETHNRKYILFVNPTLEKGMNIVISVAHYMADAYPDIPWLVVESRGSWPSHIKLHNVTVWPHQADMRQVYREVRITFIPSLWWESSSRVGIESLVNGIPVVATNHGGLPETIGSGGILINLPSSYYEPPYNQPLTTEMVHSIADVLARLYYDDHLYQSYSQAALAYALRVHNLERNTDRLIDFLSTPY